MKPYLFSKVYDSNLSEISLEKAFANYQIFDKQEVLIPIRNKVRYYLPRILSINTYNRPVKEIKRGIISPLKEKLKKERQSSANYHNMGIEDAIALSRKLLPMISDARADDRNDWMTIGWTLYNITEGHPDGLDLWCEFSSRCEEKYDENVCIYQWDRMVKKDYTIGTLRHFAKIDNPVEYKKLKEERSEKHIIESLEGSHTDIAKALYEEYGDEFVCVSIVGKVWYQFRNHKWEEVEDGVTLRSKISGSLAEKYKKASLDIYLQMSQEEDKSKQNMLALRMKEINKIRQKLKTVPFKKNVMTESMDVFYDPRFKEKLNQDPYLICFKNGVYDLKLDIFRAGRPEDFISRCLPINYIAHTEDDEKVQEIYTFLEQVFPDNTVRKYFLDISSKVFVGGNQDKIAVFWTGEGDNGKSVTQTFFEKMLGKLCAKMNTGNITGKKPNPGNAYADLARTGDGIRWVVLEEPEGDEQINSGTLKHWTGNDSFYARDLYEKGKGGTEITPLFKLTIITNKLPRIKHSVDKAVWNRVRVVPFESTFCKACEAPDTYEEQLRQKRFPKDGKFTQKIPLLVEAFAWVLLEHKKKIKDMPLEEPPKVMAATELYRKQNDNYRQFLDECIIEDKKKFITLTELYAIFREWFREGFPGQTVPVKNDVEEYFLKLWGQYRLGKKWLGYKQRTLNDDVDKPVFDDNGNEAKNGIEKKEDNDEMKSLLKNTEKLDVEEEEDVEEDIEDVVEDDDIEIVEMDE